MLRIFDDGEEVPEDLKEIFSGELYTGETTGVGGVRYYMLRQIAQHINAQIDLQESELGGARFDIYLKTA